MSQADVLAQMRKLQDEKISWPTKTLDIKEQAATAPVSAFTDGSVTLTQITNVTVQSCAITATGSPIFIHWSVRIEPAVPPDAFYVRLYQGSTLIYESYLILDAHHITSGSMTDTPSAGDYTYYFKVYSVDHTCTAYQRSLMLLEVKR